MSKTLQAIIAFILGTSAILIFIYFTEPPCEAISNYQYNSINHLLSRVLRRLALMGGVFVAGTILFYILHRRDAIVRSWKFTVIYWGVLPLLIFAPMLITRFSDLQHCVLQKSICWKSADISSGTISEGLDVEEYQYLQKQLPLLPDLPISTDSINLYYYLDQASGDYNLNIELILKELTITTIPEMWKIEVDSSKNLSTLRYSKHQT